MEPPAEQSETHGVEERLARVEALLTAQGETSEKSPMQRALKFLPLLAVSNFLVAVPAFVLSVVVAYFTFIGAEATEKMQIASVWPHVAYETSNRTEDGDKLIRLSLTNKGVGPAHIKGMEVSYQGRAYPGFHEILSACCSDNPAALSMGMATIVGAVLSPGDDLMFAELYPDKVPPDVWEKFEAERLKLKVRVCYCSVFDDCWIAEGGSGEPKPVKSCPIDWTQFVGSSELGLGDR